MRTTEASFPEEGGVPIDSYGEGGFRVGGVVHRGPLALLPSGPRPWVGLPDLALFVEHAASFDVLILGMGAGLSALPEAAAGGRDALEAAGTGIERMATPSACRSYNVLLAEGRRVAAALMPIETRCSDA